jgi:hypothetical protein
VTESRLIKGQAQVAAGLMETVMWALENEAVWRGEGFDSREGYLRAFQESTRFALPRDERRAMGQAMADMGATVKEIAAAQGVAERTVVKDRQEAKVPQADVRVNGERPSSEADVPLLDEWVESSDKLQLSRLTRIMSRNLAKADDILEMSPEDAALLDDRLLDDLDVLIRQLAVYRDKVRVEREKKVTPLRRHS